MTATIQATLAIAALIPFTYPVVYVLVSAMIAGAGQ